MYLRGVGPAVKIIESLGFDGSVYIPEHPDWVAHGDYEEQIHWEWEAINNATVVAFWIPRDIATMPAFTTNVEFGMLATTGKIILGFPPGAPKNRYLVNLAARYGMYIHDTLEETMAAAVTKAVGLFW